MTRPTIIESYRVLSTYFVYNMPDNQNLKQLNGKDNNETVRKPKHAIQLVKIIQTDILIMQYLRIA